MPVPFGESNGFTRRKLCQRIRNVGYPGFAWVWRRGYKARGYPTPCWAMARNVGSVASEMPPT